MLIQFLFLINALFACGVSIWLINWLDDMRKSYALFVCTGIASGFAALILAIALVVTAIARPIGRSSCAEWSKQTNVPTKFVLLNSWDSGTCLAKTPDGHWVLNSNWQAFINVRK